MKIKHIPTIDAHSHSTGLDIINRDGVFPKEASYDDYCRGAAHENIVHTIFMPAPNPVYYDKSRNLHYSPAVWKRNMGIKYFKKWENEKERQAPKYPFMEANRDLLDSYQEALGFSVALLHHPVLDKIDDGHLRYLEKNLELKHVVGIKHHAVATHTSVNDIDKRVIGLLRKHGKVLIAHCDWPKNLSDDPLNAAYKKAHPRKILDFAERTGIKVFATHGLRADLESIQRVNEMDNVLVGVGPVCLLEKEPERLSREPYLQAVMGIKNKAYDVDFWWNTEGRHPEAKFVWNGKRRCLAMFKHFSDNPEEDAREFFFERSNKFFNLDLNYETCAESLN